MYQSSEPFPISDDASRRGLTLPTHALLTRADVDRISSLLKGGLKGTRYQSASAS
jgi:hypothetical protein